MIVPGLLAALLCGFIYFGFGTQWTFRPRPSLYVHHTLTAKAWLAGRTYVTAAEIERQFVVNSLLRDHRPIRAWSDDQLRKDFEQAQAEYFRSLGVPEKDIASEIAGSLRRAFLDWVRIDERYYAYWPPVPAALLVPIVAIFGTNFSDVVVANVLGALTVFFVYCMLLALRRHWSMLTPRACLGLTLFYGLGTCHMYQASTGQVWLITQLCATLFLVLAITCAFLAVQSGTVRRSWLLAAACTLALGFLSRNTIILAAPFLLVLLWISLPRDSHRVQVFLKSSLPCLTVLLAAILVQLAFNQVRFGHPLDFGQGRLAKEGGNDIFAEEFREHGRFNLCYVPRNVWYYFLNPTIRQFPAYEPAQVGWTFDPMGNSLFLISPLFAYIFLSGRSTTPRLLLWPILAGAIPGLTALMLFHGTGWYQFGQRYLLDVLPFFLLLTAFGIRGRLSRVSLAMIAMSFGINAWGTHRFILEQG